MRPSGRLERAVRCTFRCGVNCQTSAERMEASGFRTEVALDLRDLHVLNHLERVFPTITRMACYIG